MALRYPELYSSVIPVDNAPVDAALSSNFSKYVHGMRMIMDAQVTRTVEADDILKTFEQVKTFIYFVSFLVSGFLDVPSVIAHKAIPSHKPDSFQGFIESTIPHTNQLSRSCTRSIGRLPVQKSQSEPFRWTRTVYPWNP